MQKSQSWGSQLWTLMRRYVSVLASDRGFLALMVILPAVLGVVSMLIPSDYGLGYGPTKPGGFRPNRDASTIMLILAVGMCFSGAANSVRELIKERVIYERERGSSWAEIGRYLRLTAEQAEATYGGDVLRWRAAFDEPYRLDGTGRKRIPNLPPAAYDPVRAGGVLDRWAKRHLPLVNHPHPVARTT